MQRPQDKQRRKRGVILTAQGLDKLQQAKTQSEFESNGGRRYTYELLSEKTGLAVDTLMKVLACEDKVDKQTLKYFFRAFNLILSSEDYSSPDCLLECPLEVDQQKPEFPEGQVALNSPFYVERPPIEAECYKAIVQPGSLIRIKAPKRMGKTSLMRRILQQAANQGCRTVSLNLQLTEKRLLQDLDKFLRCFCATVTEEMQLPNRLDDYWDDLFGSNISCKLYFEQYLLPHTEQPLVIGLDDVDQLFLHPELADDFFALLRVWHEEGKNKAIWQKLRLVVVHSTEVYIPLNIHQSPFNVGLPIALPPFTLAQVRDLADRYQLSWSDEGCGQLMNLVGGKPQLIHLAIYSIAREETSLEQLLKTSMTVESSIYKEHLQRQLWSLQQSSHHLVETFARVVMAERPIELEMVKAFQLESLGLIHLQNLKAVPSCQLYKQYFRKYFGDFYQAI